MSYTLEQKFEALCRINRVSFFEWRETFMKLYPEKSSLEAVLQYWEIVGHDTAKAYLKRVDKSKPVAPQIAQMIVDSSLAMGESARVVEGDDEVRVIHDICPWYDWHKKFDAVAEDQPGCDCWLKTIATDVNQELGTSIDVETVSSLPHGDERCERIFREKD